MNKYIVIAIIICLVAVAGIVVFGKGKTTGNTITESRNVKEFTLNATRFQYAPDTITVNKGDKVKININNIDTKHGIRIPDLGIKANDVLEFTADKQGEFVWYCTNMCGEGHRDMQGKLIVK